MNGVPDGAAGQPNPCMLQRQRNIWGGGGGGGGWRSQEATWSIPLCVGGSARRGAAHAVGPANVPQPASFHLFHFIQLFGLPQPDRPAQAAHSEPPKEARGCGSLSSLPPWCWQVRVTAC